MKNLHYSLLLPFLLLGLVVAHPLSAHADDLNSFYFYSNSSLNPQSISLDDLDKITFGDNGLKLWKQSGTQEITFDDFLLFTFMKMEHPIVTNVRQEVEPKNVYVNFDSNSKTIIVESFCILNGVSVYDLQGRLIVQTRAIGRRYQLSLSSAAPGLYFVKAKCGSETIINKIIKK